MKKQKISGKAEAWEVGKLGLDEKFIKPAPQELQQKIDLALNVQTISIRLPTELIDDFKFIATHQEANVQSLIRKALKKYADQELLR